MAYLTDKQAAALFDLTEQYGEPYTTKIEYTLQPSGVVWVHWIPSITDIHGVSRHLFIRPDGTRLAWESISLERRIIPYEDPV